MYTLFKIEYVYLGTLLWGKDTKEKTNNEEDVERVADEIPSELGGE
eukprot:SAG11_NODE_1998_length_3943_cov_6.764828_1_plen_45_part_10